MKKSSKIALIIALTTSVLFGCSNKDNNLSALEKIESESKVKVGITADYPPYEFYTLENGKEELAGMDIELAKYIAKNLGVDIEFVDMEFSNLLTSLSLGKVDMIISGMNPDPTRAKQVNFTDLYHTSSFSLLYKEGENLESLEDLKGKKIGVQLGTTQEKLLSELDGIELVTFNKNPDIIMNIKTNKIDYGVMEGPVASSFVKANKGLKIFEHLPISTSEEGMAIAVKKNEDELTERLNQILKEVKSENLMEEWFLSSSEKSNKNLN